MIERAERSVTASGIPLGQSIYMYQQLQSVQVQLGKEPSPEIDPQLFIALWSRRK